MTQRERRMSHYRQWWLEDTKRAHWAATAFVGDSPEMRLLLLYFAQQADPFGCVSDMSVAGLLRDTGLPAGTILTMIRGLTKVGYIGSASFDHDEGVVTFDLPPVSTAVPPAEHLSRPPLASFRAFSPAQEIYG